MNTNLIKRVGLMALGGVIGGITGYLLGGLVIDQLQKKNEEEEIVWTQEFPREPDTEPEVVVRTSRDYTKFAKEKADLAELVRPYKSPETKIHIISFEEYQENRNLNKEPIAFYEMDGIFADAQEKTIPDPNSLFVPNVQLHFGEESEDPDIVYVRNESRGVDYEITRINDYYAVVILGQPAPPPKAKPKRRRSVKKTDDNEEPEDESE